MIAHRRVGRAGSPLHAGEKEAERLAQSVRALSSTRGVKQAANRLGLREFVVERDSMLRRQDVHRDLPMF